MLDRQRTLRATDHRLLMSLYACMFYLVVNLFNGIHVKIRSIVVVADFADVDIRTRVLSDCHTSRRTLLNETACVLLFLAGPCKMSQQCGRR